MMVKNKVIILPLPVTTMTIVMTMMMVIIIIIIEMTISSRIGNRAQSADLVSANSRANKWLGSNQIRAAAAAAAAATAAVAIQRYLKIPLIQIR